jgi:hypothetical protein
MTDKKRTAGAFPIRAQRASRMDVSDKGDRLLRTALAAAVTRSSKE